MQIIDIITLNFYIVKPLIPTILVIVILTTLVFGYILVGTKGIWFGKKSFDRFGLFVELNAALAIKLACAWIKLLCVSFYLIAFASLDAIQYIFLLVPCLGVIVISRGITEVITHILSIAVQIVGLLIGNILCSYIVEFEMKITYISIYILMSVVIILYSIYIFIIELDYISDRRSIKIEKTNITE